MNLAPRLLSAFLCCGVFFCSACARVPETQPLRDAGMGYSTISALREMNVSDAEVSELAAVVTSGVSEQDCVALLRLARERNQPFDSGSAVVGLRRAGLTPAGVMELARLNQLGAAATDARIILLSGFSEALILERARRISRGQPSLGGASLARLKNTGMSEAAILALLRGGATDDQVDAIVARREASARPGQFRRR